MDVSSTPESPFSAAATDKRLLIYPLSAVLVAGIICTTIASAMAGTKGLLAGVLATLVVLGFFGGGQYVVARVLRRNPGIALNTALLVYVIQMLVLFILLAVLQDATFFAPKAFALTVVAGVLTWTVAAMAVLMKSQVLYVEPATTVSAGDMADDPDAEPRSSTIKTPPSTGSSAPE